MTLYQQISRSLIFPNFNDEKISQLLMSEMYPPGSCVVGSDSVGELQWVTTHLSHKITYNEHKLPNYRGAQPTASLQQQNLSQGRGKIIKQTIIGMKKVSMMRLFHRHRLLPHQNKNVFSLKSEIPASPELASDSSLLSHKIRVLCLLAVWLGGNNSINYWKLCPSVLLLS